MRLYLLRHAEASYDFPTDEARELTPKGVRSIAKLCDRVKRKELSGPQAIHHSTLVRARQTAELLHDGLKLEAPLVETVGLAPMDDPTALGNMLWKTSQDLMFVGHNPHLSLLTSWLLTGDIFSDCINFKKSGLLCLERESPPRDGRPAGVWVISWYFINRPFAE